MYVKTVIWLVLACAVVITEQNDARESRTVHTSQGPVRGYKSDDGELFQFFGIPYATAPTGARRFTAPLPGPISAQLFEAVDKGIICPQPHTTSIIEKKQQENCLIANIHVPNTDETNLPVLVYIHGGLYSTGFGEMNSPFSLLRSKKLIAVTFNYRLGAHGFLCLGTEDAPGNAGMKDQVALLRWVQKNIVSFGGNPDNVTIAGSGTGASSVELLVLSDMTKGLFNKAISESGSDLSAWAIQIEPLDNAKHFARNVKFSNDIVALENYYKSASFDDLTSQGELIEFDSPFQFTPCVERDVGQEMFLKNAPLNIIKQKNIRNLPVLSGFFGIEGLSAMQYMSARIDPMNEHFSDFLPPNLQFKSEDEKTKTAKIVKELYFGNKLVGDDNHQYIEYFSDIMTYGHLRSLRLKVEAGSDSIYLYEYSFYSPQTQGLYPEFMKESTHDDGKPVDYSYLFGDKKEFLKKKADLEEMWINFITTGKPVPEGSSLPDWPPVGAKRYPVMLIGDQIRLTSLENSGRRPFTTRFWDEIYDQFYKPPQPPTPHRIKNEL